ncbi:MAG TPA: hypothetical protein PKM41_00765 [Deltaproteobacteria bacterium]|nr:hypothetical protein [Deltaproteobacteria bacterium]HOI05924.1 hypothetical protein [Deltaproteobacteria bacterium]
MLTKNWDQAGLGLSRQGEAGKDYDQAPVFHDETFSEKEGFEKEISCKKIPLPQEHCVGAELMPVYSVLDATSRAS